MPRIRQCTALAAPALLIGAALEYFLDPRNGRRRRHVARDRAAAAVRRSYRRLERQARYESGKLAGVAHRARKIVSRENGVAAELDDVGLVRKVESELFCDRAVPKGRISINADRGTVTLRGQLDSAEQIERVVERARKIAGAHEVQSLLHLPGTPAPASRPRSVQQLEHAFNGAGKHGTLAADDDRTL